MATNRTIVLKGDLHRWHDEADALDASIKPGYLLEYTSAGKVKAHTARGGRVARHFAKEDGYRGGTREGTLQDGSSYYATDDKVFIHRSVVGDRINAVLKAGDSVTYGDYIISNGDGRVTKAASVVLANTVADSTAVTNTTSETTFSNGSVTIPANSLKAGDRIRVRGYAIATSTNSTDTLTVKIYIGSTAVVTIPATDVANNDVLFFDVTILVRTAGAPGTAVATGSYNIGAEGTGTSRVDMTASFSIDTTASTTITTKATWSVASASNSVVLREFYADKVNSGSAGSLGGAGGDVLGQARETLDLSAESDDDFVDIEIL